MRGYFVTGTDTDVGKTVVTAVLVAGLRARGIDAVPMKPVQTGCNGSDELRAPDLDLALELSGYVPRQDEEKQLVPYRFAPACSPHLAAADAGMTISLDRIMDAFQVLRAAHEMVVVEGAGGALVPLNDHEFMIDLMVRLELPVLLAARPTLGTLNHTLLTLEALHRRSLDIAAVIMVACDNAPLGAIEADNVETVRRLGEVPVLGPLPYLPGLNNGQMTGADLLSAFQAHLAPLFTGAT